MSLWDAIRTKLISETFAALIKPDSFQEIRTKIYPSTIKGFSKEFLIASRIGNNSYQLKIKANNIKNSEWLSTSALPNIMPATIENSITNEAEQSPITLSEALIILERFEENHLAKPIDETLHGSIHYIEIKNL